jgi:chromosome segregation ATPase
MRMTASQSVTIFGSIGSQEHHPKTENHQRTDKERQLLRANRDLARNNTTLQQQCTALHTQVVLHMEQNLQLHQRLAELTAKLQGQTAEHDNLKRDIEQASASLHLMSEQLRDMSQLLKLLAMSQASEEVALTREYLQTPAAKVAVMDLSSVTGKTTKRRRVGLKDRSNLERIPEE